MASQRTRGEVIAKWLARYALVIRDHDGAPAQVSRATIEAYEEFLRECQPEQLDEAMRECGAMVRFFPTPYLIREVYRRLAEDAAAGPKVKCNACVGAGFVMDQRRAKPCAQCGTGRKRENT